MTYLCIPVVVWAMLYRHVQHLDELESEAEEKGGVQQVLADHFAKIYKLDWQHRHDLDWRRRTA
jgi:hypothetical protein